MDRRSFIKTGGSAALGFSAMPQMAFGTQTGDSDYTISELMGKEDIELVGTGIDLRVSAHEAFVAMKKAASTEGIALKIVSSYRSYGRQRAIWERKFVRFTEELNMSPLAAIDKIIEYSTIPGTSRHHWGTDVDVVDGTKKVEGDVLVPAKFGAGQPYAPFKRWMDDNAWKFGFHLVYTDQPKRRGFKYEPWHYSYAPLSIPMLTQFRSMNILKLLEAEDFLGADHFTNGFLKSYVQDNILDINPALL